MDEKRTDLRATLRELAGEEAGDAGPHVGLKRLIAYRQGTLPAAERETVQEHLSLCPRCTRLLLELRDFETAAASGETGPESLQQEAWDSLVRQLPPKTPVVRPIASAARREAQRQARRPRFVVGAAAALLLAAAGFTLWATVTVLQERQRLARLEQRLEEREAALAALERSLAGTERQLAAVRGQIQDREKERTAREDELEAKVAELSAELAALRRPAQPPERRDRIAVASETIAVSVSPRFALRGQEIPDTGFLRGAGEANVVRPKKDRITVALSLARHPADDEYRLELVDRDGKVLWTGVSQGRSLLGDAGTSVSVSGLGPGLYRLRIHDLNPDRSELLDEYLLEVKPR